MWGGDVMEAVVIGCRICGNASSIPLDMDKMIKAWTCPVCGAVGQVVPIDSKRVIKIVSREGTA